ncbi:protocadherin-18 isoform X2 [Octopus bimaculoides]|uniref:protocadherin-18 isoform X2 n=1 Tax=Octopus bimaculoides TaxID=37653 RepID=UPI00071C8111|nr:protocadherin-18 isoform X2 [Octopus bimaculoides]|eukprot:XP_014774859.1 PREDICTED: protocadherin-18-like isoform X2 [Octopus bimaculoides]
MYLHVCVLLLLLLDYSFCIDFTYHVKEGQSPGLFIGDIASDTEVLRSIPPRDHSFIRFSLLQENTAVNSQLFNVSKTGRLYTSQVLDAEPLCKYNKECSKIIEIAVQNKKAFVKILEIKVLIEDINDHQPEFANDKINLEFSEGDAIGMAKSIPNAIDRDASILNSQIVYYLKKDLDDPFNLSVLKTVDGASKLEIILIKRLNREIRDTYNLEVVAKDKGSPPQNGVLYVQISVTDENDNSPVFTKTLYNISLRNTQERSLPIVKLSATDTDKGKNGKVTYSFSSKMTEPSKKYFRLNAETGEILLSQHFQSEVKQNYQLFIDAKDGGNPPMRATAIVFINMINQENNPPKINVKFFSKTAENKATISEDIEVGSFIAYLKITDNDIGQNGEVECKLKHNKFMLQKMGRKKYKVVVQKTVNREIEDYTDFIIICEDRGSPPLQTEKKFLIKIMDVNDVQPSFTKNTFKFLTYENEDSNFPVGLINATDPDLGPGGKLTYSFLDDNNFFPFKISNFGFIATTQSLDREKQEIYNMKVIVKDNGVPSLSSTANIIIEVMDKNDNAPYFTFPSFDPFNIDVHYHPQSKSDITTLRASDRDSHVNSFLRYEILGGNNKQLFTVNPYTGILSFSRTVYQNDAGSYNIKLAVKDSGTPILSATTTLSLTLTVSNTTARMYTAEDTESDNRIHINLMIIIVVAAVIVSVAIVVSVTTCIIRRNQNDTLIDVNDKFITEMGESEYACQSQYDATFTTAQDVSNDRIFEGTLLKKTSENNWKGLETGVQLQDLTPVTQQDFALVN